MKHALLFTVLALGASPLVHGSTAAPVQGAAIQFPAASPGSLVRNQVGLTTVEIEYSRPGMKGRQIYGGLVPYDTVWRTGANAATKITFSTDVTFGGEPVAAGSYALFTIPGKTSWTVILSKNTEQWGSYGYEEDTDATRVIAKPVALAQPVETLTIGVGDLRADSATLMIDWEKTRVPVTIETDIVSALVPQIEAAMSGDAEKKPYLQAAMFYYEYDIDLAKARAWADAAEKEQPDAPWIVYRKALIQAKAGDEAGAMATAKHAHELAEKTGGAVGAEYSRLSEELIAKLQK